MPGARVVTVLSTVKAAVVGRYSMFAGWPGWPGWAGGDGDVDEVLCDEHGGDELVAVGYPVRLKEAVVDGDVALTAG
jgi:hypothetical protein